MFLFLTFAFLLPSFSPTHDPHNHIKQSQISKLTVYLEASDLRGTDIQKHHITIFHPDSSKLHCQIRPLLFTLNTHDCTTRHQESCIVKYADNSIIVCILK